MDNEDNKLLVDLYRHYLVMKTFHFQTKYSFRHTKVDVYLENYLKNMDKLMEVIQGEDGTSTINRIIIDATTKNDDTIFEEINSIFNILETQRSRGQIISAIIDQMQADLSQLSYLFTFK